MVSWRRGTPHHLERSGYFGLPEGTPVEARAQLSDRALTMLRPRLGTAWLDTTEPAEGWPTLLARQAAEATALCRERHDSTVITVRPGFGTGTVVLNPADDEDFAMLLALAPFSSQVDVMSRDGRLVYASAQPGSAQPRSTQPGATRQESAQRQLVMRLTDQERAELTSNGDPANSIQLVRAPKLNNVPDKPQNNNSRYPGLIRRTVLFLVVGPAWVIRIADRLLSQPTLHDALRLLTKPSVLLQIVVGISAIFVGWQIFRDATSLIRERVRMARRSRTLTPQP